MRDGFPAHGGDLLWAAQRYGFDPGDFLDFSSNVNPLGPSRLALRAARESLSHISSYPEPRAATLRDELAGYLGLPPGLVMLGNGSTELIHLLARCLRPRRVAIVSPAFNEYQRAARGAGAEVRHFQLRAEDGFALPAEELAAFVEGCDLVLACNPASPSGRLYRRQELLPALQACRRGGGMLVVDESFMGFCPLPEAEEASLLGEAGGDNLVVLSTMTKLFCLAGLRGPGWLAASETLILRLEEEAVPWRVNAVAMAAARASLADEEYVRRTRDRVAEWREELALRLSRTPLFHVFPSRTNFLLLQTLAAAPQDVHLADALGRRGLLVRVCANFRGLECGFIRVAVRTPQENQRLVAALQEEYAHGLSRTGDWS